MASEFLKNAAFELIERSEKALGFKFQVIRDYIQQLEVERDRALVEVEKLEERLQDLES